MDVIKARRTILGILRETGYDFMYQEEITSVREGLKENIGKKRGRPKGSVKTKPRRITRSDDLKTMRPGEIRYYRNPDNDVTCWISQVGMAGQFKTERVVVVHLKSGETEKGVLLTKL